MFLLLFQYHWKFGVLIINTILLTVIAALYNFMVSYKVINMSLKVRAP